MDTMRRLNTMEKTVYERIADLETGCMSSVELVDYYLKRIARYDGYLKSISEIDPRARAIAQELDEERKTSGPRSSLHGIPILIKDNIQTTDGLHTTASSLALADFKAPYEATIIKRLREAGAIILGKTNLSEFAYFMSYDDMPSGYGSKSGQVMSPYHPAIDPLGSSTGSAVAVAADLISLAIGTETNGSLMAPAYQNQIVSIKPTLGLVSRYGIIPVSSKQDTAGPMAKNVRDAALLLDYMVGPDTHDEMTLKALSKRCYRVQDRPLEGLRVGVLEMANHDYDQDERQILDEAKSVLESEGIVVDIIPFKQQSIPNHQTLIHEFKHDLNHYLKSIKGYSKMTSLRDIIAFNKEDPERRLRYGQSIFEEAEATKGDLTDPFYLMKRERFLKEANRFENIMKKRGLSALLHTSWTSHAPVAGNPSIVVPAKPLNDQKPRALVFVGRRFEDDVLIEIAHAYESRTKHRIPPKLSDAKGTG
jgi:amidase